MYTINEETKLAAIADAVVMREREIFGYDLNVTNYETMLTALPSDEWPAHLAQYKTASLDQVPDEYDNTVSDYQFRDRLRHLLKTERAERSKSVRVYDALVAQLPAARLDELIDAAVARAAAAVAPK